MSDTQTVKVLKMSDAELEVRELKTELAALNPESPVLVENLQAHIAELDTECRRLKAELATLRETTTEAKDIITTAIDELFRLGWCQTDDVAQQFNQARQLLIVALATKGGRGR